MIAPAPRIDERGAGELAEDEQRRPLPDASAERIGGGLEICDEVRERREPGPQIGRVGAGPAVAVVVDPDGELDRDRLGDAAAERLRGERRLALRGGEVVGGDDAERGEQVRDLARLLRGVESESEVGRGTRDHQLPRLLAACAKERCEAAARARMAAARKLLRLEGAERL